MHKHLFPKLHTSRCALSRLFRRPISSQGIPENSQKVLSLFQQDLKAIDPKVLATAMGGNDKPPEEPLFSTAEEGFGYFTDAAANRDIRQYRFVRKLGWAGSSSVWLALDKSTRDFVAMKILTAQASARIIAGLSIEQKVFLMVKSANPKHAGFSHCLTLRDRFIAESGAGNHLCFVTDALSSSLATLREPGKNRFTLPVAKCIIRQVLLALDYLHRECGYIHTDLKSDNILVSIPKPVASLIAAYLQKSPSSVYGPPLNLKSLDLPLCFSRSQPLPYFSLGGSIQDISVRLVDYSEATPVKDPLRGHLRQPSLIRAPEVTLEYPWTSAIDIWTVGCLLFELLTERCLFNQDSDNYSHALHLQYIVECLGPFPLDFLKECKARKIYFDDNGTLLNTTSDSTPTSFEDILQTLEAVDEKEIPGTAAFLRRCLTLNPKLRPSAQVLLGDSWLG